MVNGAPVLTVCPHCDQTLRTTAKLDSHLKWDCPKLKGRRGA